MSGCDSGVEALLDGGVGDGVDVTSDQHGCVLVEGLEGLPRGFVVGVALPEHLEFPSAAIETVVVNAVDDCCSSSVGNEIAELLGDNEVLVGVAFEKIGVVLACGAVDEVGCFEQAIVDTGCDSGWSEPLVACLVFAFVVGAADEDVIADVEVDVLLAGAAWFLARFDGVDALVDVME